MMRRLGALMIGLSLIALLAAACTKAAPLPAPTPRPQATATPVPAATLASPRLSPASREALVDLARKHQKITEEWERFHVELDQWREGLPACDVSSMQRGLRGFAGDFSKITGLARALPRSPHVRKLGDKLSKAAEEEEDTFRELGDTWQPNSQRPFEKVDQQRAVAAAVQIEIEDALLDLREKTSPASRASA
ncbi:MAG: hypothetical protein HYY31_06400, partial [Chloroflexi bacterium]|nr:hypothetical protein [Chloroflexota bacterium]